MPIGTEDGGTDEVVGDWAWPTSDKWSAQRTTPIDFKKRRGVKKKTLGLDDSKRH